MPPLPPGSEPHTDSTGHQLSAVLAAYLAAERARDARALAVHALAALSVPLVLQTVWPSLGSAELVWLLRGAWALSLAAALVACVVEWRHRVVAGLGASELRPPVQ